MKFSIIIASLGNRKSLLMTLDSISNLDTCDLKGELIVVINGSPINPLRFYHPNIEFKLITESKIGHSFALNTGVLNSKGDIILFTDDDAIVSKEWLKEYVIGMSDTRVGYAFSSINPKFDKKPIKDWFEIAPKSLKGLDLGKENLVFHKASKNSDPIGVNMAVSRKIFKLGLKFNEMLGPSFVTGNVGGAETLLGRQIIQIGYFGKYIAGAAVDHLIESERLSLSYLLNRKYKIGKTAIAYDFMQKNNDFVPNMLYYIKRVLRELKCASLNTLLMRRAKSKKSLLKLSRAIGSLSIYIFDRNYYESIRKENYLFSSK